MKSASIHELKEELSSTEPAKLLELCIRLARYKKENKELLTYLLFEAHDEQGYIMAVKSDMDEQFDGINQSNLYFAKKSLRKILRTANKYTRYAGSKLVEIELLLHYCNKLKRSGIPFQSSTALNNLFNAQLKKINKALDTLHEDLQYDYQKELENLQ